MNVSRHAVALCALVLAAASNVATARAEKVLRYSDHEPLGGMRTTFINDVFFRAVEKESNGRLRIRAEWDSAIATGYDALRTIAAGNKADMGIVVPEYSDKELPLHQIFKSFPRGPAGRSQVSFFRRVFSEVPAFAAEMKRNNVVTVYIATGYPVAFFSRKALTSLASLGGDTWRTASFWHRDFLRNAGAKPVSMPWGVGVFNAMKAGTLDGLMVNIDSGYMLKVHDVAQHVLVSRDLWLGHVYLLAMNADTWESLAAEDQDAIRRAAAASYESQGDVMDRSLDAMLAEMKSEGVKVATADAGDVEAFETATRYREIQATWAKDQAAKGVADVSETLDKVQMILSKAMHEAIPGK